jgi:hypothetical protein
MNTASPIQLLSNQERRAGEIVRAGDLKKLKELPFIYSLCFVGQL